jgi:autophagy-related protein 27
MRRTVDYLSLLAIVSISLWASPSLGDDSSFNCHVTAENHDFDLTPLTGEHTINRTRQTPPSEMIDSLKFNLCGDLEILESMPRMDQVRA